MSDKPIEDMKTESTEKGKDGTTRTILVGLLALWLLTVAAFSVVTWRAYFDEKDKTQTLAQQIALACENGDFGAGLSDEDQAALCGNAEKVLDNQGEIQDDEIQESEIQEPEIQNPEVQDEEIQERERQEFETQEAEIQEPEVQNEETQDEEVQDEETQDPENQDPENQENEIQNEETQDPEIQDEEVQDEEIQDPEIDDPEIQDPEIDDPDPASPFDFTFVFTVPGPGGSPGQTYTVGCNSGTGACVVTGG